MIKRKKISNLQAVLLVMVLGIILSPDLAALEDVPSVLEIIPTASGHLNAEMIHDDYNLQLKFSLPGFRLLADMSMLNDGKYSPSESYMFGRYFYLNESSLSFSEADFSFTAGRLLAASFLQTPYSLYLSSSDIPAVGMSFKYEGEHFFYFDRWIRLNERSGQKYPDNRPDNDGFWRDRGMNHKSFGLVFGPWRYGFQDSVVYLDRSFDWEYFLSPMPQYFVQLVTTSGGKPWTEQNNDNSLMGFFAEYTGAPLYLETQVLVDDINASFLPWIEVENLTKIAWNLGGHWQFPWGKLGFYHAGATKYTFAATYTQNSYSNLPYEYTYFPATEYSLKGGELRPLLPEDNYLGYLYGENNLAFRLTYAHTLWADLPGELVVDGFLEWVINGSKSPANPWHEYDNWRQILPHVELLSDPVSEHILRLNGRVVKPWREFEFLADLTLGGRFNGLQLVEVSSTEPKIFRPAPGNHTFLFELELGVRYRWGVWGG